MEINELPKSFAAFDLETTGFAPPCRIIEIGAVKVRDGIITEKFQQLVDPGIMIPWNISMLTGITDDMVRGAPAVDAALLSFLEFVGDMPIVAHNAKFDMRFISYYAAECGYNIKNHVFDTLLLSRKMVPGLGSYKLGVVAKHLSAEETGAHRALSDAMMVAKIMLRMDAG